MELKDIASVSGKPGLYKIIKQARTGLVLESLDAQQTKIVTGPSHRVSILSEISIYTNDYDTTIPLQEIFTKIKDEFGEDPGVDGKSDPEELKAFLEHVAPEYDKARVYVSDMRKLAGWYHILFKVAPEVLVTKEEEKEKSIPSSETTTEEKVPESSENTEKPKKSPAKSKTGDSGKKSKKTKE